MAEKVGDQQFGFAGIQQMGGKGVSCLVRISITHAWVQALKQSNDNSPTGRGGGTFACTMPPPRFKTSIETSYVDEKEQRKKAAQAYARAKGG